MTDLRDSRCRNCGTRLQLDYDTRLLYQRLGIRPRCDMCEQKAMNQSRLNVAALFAFNKRNSGKGESDASSIVS